MFDDIFFIHVKEISINNCGCLLSTSSNCLSGLSFCHNVDLKSFYLSLASQISPLSLDSFSRGFMRKSSIQS